MCGGGAGGVNVRERECGGRKINGLNCCCKPVDMGGYIDLRRMK